MTATKRARWLQWPPYGFMCQEFEEAAAYAKAPRRWKGPPFATWIDQVTDDLARFAWPRWTGAGWQGEAASFSEDLTRADLEIMAGYAAKLVQPARQDGDKLNSWWFGWEDDLAGASWIERMKLLFPGTAVNADDLGRTFCKGATSEYYGDAVFMLKQRLQRPRAYHMSYALGTDPIWQQSSISAWSPSSISGHAFQGIMGALAAYRAYDQLKPFRSALVKLGADIGDRRVMAGLHYPSDNAMSWWVALQCVEHVADSDADAAEMRAFVRDAMHESTLWSEMQASKPHQRLLDNVN